MFHRRRTLWLLLLSLGLLVCRGGAPIESKVPATEDEVPRLAPQALKALLDAGEKVVIADSRTLWSYNVRHIAEAISMPFKEVGERYDELPRDLTIVFYCT